MGWVRDWQRNLRAGRKNKLAKVRRELGQLWGDWPQPSLVRWKRSFFSKLFLAASFTCLFISPLASMLGSFV
jgi:hypothetical protein